MDAKKILMILIVSFLIVPIVYSIGIGLWVDEIMFYPNLNENYNAFVNNNMGYDARVRLVTRGGLAEYITFSDEYLDIPAGGRAHFTFNLKLPESIPPGRNRIDIGAEDATSTGGGGISAKTAVYMGFYVRAPYPGKYIDAGLSASNIEKGQIAIFYVNIISRGDETIDRIDGIIEIFDKDNRIATLTPEPITGIKPTESRTMQAVWDTTDRFVGEYSAKATINYDGEELELDTTFRIGSLLIEIIDHTKEFYKDEINKFDIGLQSFWNKDIADVYGEIEVDGEKIKTLKTNLGAWSKATITAYLDTTNLALGEHRAKIKAYYSGEVAEETAQIAILPKREKIVEVELPSKIPSTTILLIAVVVLLVVGNIILVLYFIKHQKSRRDFPGRQKTSKNPEKKVKKK